MIQITDASRRLEYHFPIIQPDGDLHRFLHREIGSEEAFDILLFLYRHRERSWTSEEIRSTLSIDPDATASSSRVANRRIELRLAHLFERGLIREDAATSSFRFNPSDDRHAAFVGQLADDKEDRKNVLALIYRKPRTGAAAFADAFGPGPKPL